MPNLAQCLGFLPELLRVCLSHPSFSPSALFSMNTLRPDLPAFSSGSSPSLSGGWTSLLPDCRDYTLLWLSRFLGSGVPSPPEDAP